MFYYCVLLLTALLCVLPIETVEPAGEHESSFTADASKSCPSEGCPDTPKDADHDSKQQGDQFIQYPPPTADESEGHISDLAEVPGDPAWWDLLSKAKTELARVTHTLHDTLSSITSRFADIVRKIMNEEMYDILATLMTKIGNLIYQPGEALYELFEAILSTTLLLICFVSSYVLLKLFPLLFVLSFLSTMFLLHYFLGPLKIFKGIYLAGKHLLGVSWIIAMHPYITSAIIVVLIVLAFIYSILMTFRRWSAQRDKRKKKEEMYSQVRELSTKVQAIEDTQKVMLNIQEEVLKILRELKGNNGSSHTTEDRNKHAEEG